MDKDDYYRLEKGVLNVIGKNSDWIFKDSFLFGQEFTSTMC